MTPPSSSQLDELLAMLLALHEYGVSRTGTVSYEELGSLMLGDACRLMEANRGEILLFDEQKNVLSSVASHGPMGTVTPQAPVSPNDGAAGRAYTSGKPVYEDGLLSAPMLLGSKPIGVINLRGKLSAYESRLKLLALLGTEAAMVIHHQRMYDDLQVFYLDMVRMLARAVETKDSYAQDRSEESRRLARAVGGELGLPEQMIRYVEFAALLHGVGKMGVDQAILSKPGKLTPEEFEQVKKHTSIGHRILAPVKFLGPVSQMVLYHQEWFNGKGYPEGRKGEDIPLGSRIVAVIIAWEAMNSDRPYRKALSRDVAIDQLKKGSGTQFDPKVVEAFLRVEARAAK